MPELKEAPKLETKLEILSNQAIKFLKAQGYSSQFISYVGQMLTEATNKNRDADMHTTDFAPHKQKMTGPIPMPKNLDGLTTESPADAFFGSKKNPIMPNIGLYSPTSTFTPDVYKAFASREGQRFIKKEFNWLRKDAKSGEWTIKKPVTKVADLIPKKKIHSIPTRA